MLRSFIVAVSTLLFLSGCANVVPVPVKESFQELRDVTVFIETDMGSCSGVVVAPLHVLTAAHCDGEGMKVEGKPAIVLKKDVEKDLMLVMTLITGPSLPIASQRPDVDTKLFQIGFPHGIGEVVTEGRMQEMKVTDLPYHMLVSTLGSFGNSGGPIVVRTAEGYALVGISSMVAVAGFQSPVTHLQLVVNTETIKEFVKANKLI